MSLPVRPGDSIGGTYVIERLLGQGGMGAVFVAHEEQLGRRVAIKFLLSDVMKNPEAVARFEREARAAAALQSDHVTRVLSIGQHESGARYIVMELLDGEDLAATLTRRGPLPASEVIGIMIKACDALAEAHALGIVHRDLKPANIFLAQRPNGTPTVKVLDFGISKTVAGAASKVLTSTTAMMGTPLYMSPEQLREARTVDGRADLWALGVTMYQLLTGETPFAAEALAELCVQILLQEPVPLLGRRPDLPPALGAIVGRCLKKDPADRFATATQLAAALQEVGAPVPTAYAPTVAHASVPQMPLPPAASPGPHGTLGNGPVAAPLGSSAATVNPLSSTPLWLEPRRPRALGLALGALAMISIGGVAAVVLRSGSGASSSAAGEPGSAHRAAHVDAYPGDAPLVPMPSSTRGSGALEDATSPVPLSSAGLLPVPASSSGGHAAPVTRPSPSIASRPPVASLPSAPPTPNPRTLPSSPAPAASQNPNALPMPGRLERH